MTRPDDEQPRQGSDRKQGRGAQGAGRPAGQGRPSSSGAGRPQSGGRGRPQSGGSGRPSSTTGRPSGPPRANGRPGSEGEEWTYDPRREARRQMARVPLPDDVSARELDYSVQKELKGLAAETAELVAKHLVMAGRLMDTEPEKALLHARAARALGGRVAAVREANGLVAYTAGEWTEALSELRTARRLSGDPEHLPVMADCERALGRPDRALLVADDPQAKTLSPAARVELLIVASGARRDMGQFDTAVVSLQVAALEGPVRPWTARLRYAYADALLHAGREDEARQWFSRTMDIDEQGETDAEERLMELDGVVFEDLEDGDDAVEPEVVTLSATDLVAMVADMSTPRPGEAQVPSAERETAPDKAPESTPERLETVIRTSAGPAFSSETPAEPEAVRAPIVAPSFQEPPAAAPTDEDDREDDELRLFD